MALFCNADCIAIIGAPVAREKRLRHRSAMGPLSAAARPVLGPS
jgi:hypothetical protein